MSKRTGISAFQALRPMYERTSMHRNVIEEVDDSCVRDAYAHCRSVTREHAKTFYLATRFLPNHKQRSIFAIYALCRHLDNIVDEAEDLSGANPVAIRDAGTALNEWKFKLEQTYEEKQADNYVLVAFSDVLKRHAIPISLPFELIDGVQSDLVKNRYENFEELYDYSYKVASVVGLMTSEVFGYDDEKALDRAVDLGIAMQLTNILRDIGEDLQRDRIYLPLDELHSFGLTENDIQQKQVTPDFKSFMRFQIDRARRYYASSDEGIPLLSPDSRIPVLLARHNYARILDCIEKNNYQVFDSRAHLTWMQKMTILPKAWWLSNRF
ncbi:phytoene/squalene synthase family protein [Natronogracilivirga saccharolytica]|uniref:Squalene/phytoene synthase family protein n=1 Tax=Natronogracilivirga saccharolytica TaxID=2812953 RepID=A0A8J7RJK6_9BACT|nr:squalene/phytoene synthase family protein [Natronogracilivirga saccharolytica]MBP3192925.1 squalene/phytoene synthase family protein [Natronogracilivirga saccharolytica]